jgi:hypothetical protein
MGLSSPEVPAEQMRQSVLPSDTETEVGITLLQLFVIDGSYWCLCWVFVIFRSRIFGSKGEEAKQTEGKFYVHGSVHRINVCLLLTN